MRRARKVQIFERTALPPGIENLTRRVETPREGTTSCAHGGEAGGERVGHAPSRADRSVGAEVLNVDRGSVQALLKWVTGGPLPRPSYPSSAGWTSRTELA
jgi:hypothetical protein